MRYYKLSITEPGSGKQLLGYTSHPNGKNAPPDPGALQVEIDAFMLFGGQSSANSSIRVWGIPIDIVQSGSNYNLMNCTLEGGMGKGLPLANPTQTGTLAAGQIIQAFGNWVGTDMTLDLILQPGYGEKAEGQEPRNLTVNMPENTEMRQMIDQALQTGFPGLQRQINIRDNLKLPNAEVGFYGTLSSFAQYVMNLSRKIAGAQNYPGVQIFPLGNTIYVTDGSAGGAGGTGASNSPKQISFLDLIGQPVWIAPQTVQAQVVMRGDIKCGDFIKLPDGLITTTASSLSTFSTLKQKTAFKGNFWVQKIRHIGNYKQADGRAWSTVMDCLAIQGSDGGLAPNYLGPGYGVQTGPNYD